MSAAWFHPKTSTLAMLGLVLALSACAGPTGTAPGAGPTTPGGPAAPAISAVQEFPDQGTAHLPDGETFAYNSNPPTSGSHAAQFVPRWGVYNQAIPKEWLVHNMEHGGVIVWFNCQTRERPLSEADCNRLLQQLAGVAQPLIDGGKNVVVSPYADMEHRVALTAWTKLQTLDQFNEQAIRTFVERFDRAYNPEGF